MSGIHLPNGSIGVFRPPWEQRTPEGTQMVLSTLPKELVDHLVDRIAAEVLQRIRFHGTPWCAAFERALELDTLAENDAAIDWARPTEPTLEDDGA